MGQDRAGIVTVAALRKSCKDCGLRELCLPVGIDAREMAEFERIVRRRRTVKKGEALYRAGDRLRSLYAVRHGTFKAVGRMEDGRVHIAGFFLASELLGLDAIIASRHPCSAVAVERSEVCEIPYQAIERLAQRLPGLQHRLLTFMSREIVRDEDVLMMLGHMGAEERLAACLLGFSRRQARLHLSETELHLGMSREDLGRYLGLALATLSRAFGRFKREGLIAAHGRDVRLLDLTRLRALIGGSGRSTGDPY